MRVTVLTDLSQPNAVYRGQALRALERLGHEVHVDPLGDEGPPEPWFEADVVYVHRFLHEPMRRTLRRLREAGVGVVWDNDDDLTSGPEGARRFKQSDALRSQRLRSNMLRTLPLAHVVTTPSELLAERYRDWGAVRVRVVGNFLPEGYAAPPRGESARGGVTIGWTAGEEHRYDLRELGLRATLLRLLEAHPGLSVASIGIDLGLPPERYRRHPLVQPAELAARVGEFDVGIAPIADIPFNHARSDVKLKEYGGAGVPWLASPVGPYAGLGERQGGRLVADGDWYGALDELVRDARLRRRLAKRGRRWAETQTAGRNARAWERPLMEAVELAGKAAGTRRERTA